MYEVPGTNFVLMGDWDNTPEPLDKIIIRLLPTAGRFYGQGWRSSTQVFLRKLAQHVKPEMTVLDFGTGTGILSIAAAKMGAWVTAVENDPVVFQSAREHFALNSVEVTLIPDNPQGQFDMVVANVGDIALNANRAMLRRALTPRGNLLWQL